MKKLLSIILSAVMLFSTLAGMSIVTKAASALNVTKEQAVNWVLSIYQSPFDFDGTHFTEAQGGDPQCVDLVKYYFSHLGYPIGAVGNSGCAYDLKNNTAVYTHYDVLDNTATPLPGDVFVWNANTYGARNAGHTGIITSVDNSNYYYVDWNGTGGKNKAGSASKPINNFSYLIRPNFKKFCSVHTWDGGTVTKQPTCKKNGVKTYKCTVCGETKTEVIKKGSKYHKYEVSKTEKATLKKNGKLKEKCSYCGKTKESTIYHPDVIKLNKKKFTYTGNKIKASVTVKDTKGKTIGKKYYKISYSKNRKDIGTHSVYVIFKGRYKGQKALKYTIVPPKTQITSLTGGTKQFTVKYKKSNGAKSYQIQYATNSKFTKNKKSVSTASLSKTVKKLSANKKYYVRVRAYKTVDKNKYYSSWSTVKSVKTTGKLTAAQAKDLYTKAENAASSWLLSGCSYMPEDYYKYEKVIGKDSYGYTLYAIPVFHKDITSVAKLRKYLSNYFTENVYDDIVSEHYRDIDGQLCFVGNWGIGSPYDYKLKSVSVNSQTSSSAKIKIQITEIDGYYKKSRIISKDLKLKKVNGKWIFTNPFYIIFGGGRIGPQ